MPIVFKSTFGLKLPRALFTIKSVLLWRALELSDLRDHPSPCLKSVSHFLDPGQGVVASGLLASPDVELLSRD